jgi:hypothetical protein
MKAENKQILDEYRPYHIQAINAGTFRGDGMVRENMCRIMSEEFQPGYTTDLWCAPCVFSMIKLLYRHYDEWLARQPVTVQANFPSNKSE